MKVKESVPTDEVDAVIESLVGLSFNEVVAGIQDPARFSDQITNARNG